MQLLGLHVPGTRDKDAEIAKLKRELEEKDRELRVSESLRNKYFQENFDRSWEFKQKEDAWRGQVKAHSDRVETLKGQNRELTGEVEIYRTAFNALAVMQGLSPDLSQEQMLGLARQAAEVDRAANASCSLSYELFSVQVCDAADRILPRLNPREAKFFTACLGDNYTPAHERGQDWQSEHEIRQGLYREMYGDPDAYDDFEEEQKQANGQSLAEQYACKAQEERQRDPGMADYYQSLSDDYAKRAAERDQERKARKNEPEQERQQGMDLSIGL